jgi:hypothetical protein
MTPAHAGLLLLLAATIPPALAAEVTTLSDDLYFTWLPNPPRHSARCGVAILGNHTAGKAARIEWDVRVDEVVMGDARIVGVSAGAFDYADGKRTGRAPITAMEFSFEEAPETFPVQIVGAPNSDNAVRGVIELERAPRLFQLFAGSQYVTVSFHYADGSADAIRIRDYRDNDRFTRVSAFQQCLDGHTPHGNLRRPPPG